MESGSGTAPLDVLAAGIDSYAAYQRPDGELVDPIVGEPTQYGTAYFGWASAVLAERGPVSRREERVAASLAAIRATVRRLRAAPDAATAETRTPWSGFDRATGSAAHASNHLDFTWPAVMRALDVLDRCGRDHRPTTGVDAAIPNGQDDSLDDLRYEVAQVRVPDVFAQRPPSNWAMVWLAGEWRRIGAGLSPYGVDAIDTWLEPFLASFDEDLGLYVERGVPNAYDLFTRVHLTEILACGYGGRRRDRLSAFLAAGLERSLAMQLSDGSLASGYRSAGQTWTLGAQVALFTLSRRLRFADGASLADSAAPVDERALADDDALAAATWRSLDELARWQRPGAVLLPSRIGSRRSAGSDTRLTPPMATTLRSRSASWRWRLMRESQSDLGLTDGRPSAPKEPRPGARSRTGGR